MTIQKICEDIVLDSIEDQSIFALNDDTPLIVLKENAQLLGVFNEGGQKIQVKFEPKDFIKSASMLLRRIDVL